MTDPQEGQGATPGHVRPNAPKLVFLAVAVGATLTLITLAVLGSIDLGFPRPELPTTVVRVAGLVLLISGFTVAGMLSGSIPPRQADQDDGAWWKANFMRAAVTWVIAEGLAIFGGVLYFLTGDLVLLAGLGGGGLVVLVLNRPGRMMEE